MVQQLTRTAQVSAGELRQGDVVRHFNGKLWRVYSEPALTQQGMVFTVLVEGELENVLFHPDWMFELIHKEIPSPCPTCSDCPMFNAFEGEKRGLCKLFDNVSRSHHKMTQDCKNSLEEVEVILYSHEVTIDPEDGVLEPAKIETLSLFMSPQEINHETVLKQFQKYADQFNGFYLANWYWANEDIGCKF
jgi:hypothetical protein